jgi:ABC-type xylose transport system permease subunit
VWVMMGACTGLFLRGEKRHMALASEIILLVLGLATSFAALFVALVLSREPLVPWPVILFLVLFATWLFVLTGLCATRGLEKDE